VEIKQYKVTVNAIRSTLVYYISAYDIEEAINQAVEAPYKEWEVSEFDMPLGADVEAEEI
jgi:hypothetical protein